MYYILLGFVPFIGNIIGGIEKPWNHKVIILILCGIAIYIVGVITDAWDAQISILLITIVFMVSSGGIYHLIHFYPDKKIRLKFWKKQNPDNE